MPSVLEPKLQSTNKKDWGAENDPAAINMGIILPTTHYENKSIHITVKHKNCKALSSSNLSFSIVKLLHIRHILIFLKIYRN